MEKGMASPQSRTDLLLVMRIALTCAALLFLKVEESPRLLRESSDPSLRI